MNNTETYWEADGQSLHTFARSIETLSGMGPPPLRGEDITIASQPGQQWVDKVFDSNTITLAMWLRGIKPTVKVRENLVLNPKPNSVPGGYASPGTFSLTADGLTVTLSSTTTPYVFTSYTKDGAKAGQVYAFRAKVKGVMAPGSVATTANVRPHKRTGNQYFSLASPVSINLDGTTQEIAFYWKATQDVPAGEFFELSVVANGTALATSTLSIDEVMIEDVGTEIPTTPPKPFFYALSTPPSKGVYRWSGAAYASPSVWEVGNQGGKVSKAQFQSNWNDLIRLLWTPGRQVALRKRFYDGLILRQATALAEYAGGLQPSMMGPAAAKCTIDMKIAGGLFYDDNLQTVPLVNGDNNIEVLGNAPTHNILVTINGARSNVKVRNKTHGVEFTYPRPLLTGHVATIEVMDYEAQHSNGGVGYDSSSSVLHTGAPQWLILRPGLNVINLQSDSGTGAVVLQYRGAWV